MPFKIYRSSAGSGKTFTLVKEYLRIALATDSSDTYRGILAVTFTNKAAEEMKSRVMDALRDISSGDPQNTLTQLLSSELGVSPQLLSKRAHDTLRHMLHHYADLSISTIDRFSHRIIRTFAQDLGLSVNFKVELEKDILEREVFNALMAKVGKDEILTRALVDLVESASEDEKGWKIETPIKEYIRILFSEESRFHLEKLRNIDLAEFHKLRKQLRPKIQKNKTTISELAKNILHKAKQANLDASCFYFGNSGIFSYVQKTAEGELKIPGSRVLTTIEADKFYGSKIDDTAKAAVDVLKPDITELVLQCQKLVPETISMELVYDQIYAVALLDEMHRLLQQIQQEEELVHIGEFNHLISEVVMNESAPFIYERVGAKYHHFLIDEFQDTSILQWFNLLPLVDESLAHDNLCLIVGDAKQSIYRWRGGDVQQFVKLPQIHRPSHFEEKLEHSPHLATLFAERERVLKASESLQMLDSNFRSSPTVVNFNNRLFEHLQKQMPPHLAGMYDRAAQRPMRDSDGLVEIAMVRDSPDLSNDEYLQLGCEQVLTWVRQCLSDGYAPGDIAVIFRTNKQAISTALYLVENDIEVVSNESLLINNSPRVQLLVNMACFIDDPTDRVNIAELTQNLSACVDGIDLNSELMALQGGKHPERISELLKRFIPELDWNKLQTENPYMLLCRLAHVLFNGATESNLSFFLDHVLSYCEKNRVALSDFLEHWKEKRDKLSIAMDESPNSVRILTIHKSKGLEFPVVIHPFADYPDNKGKRTFGWIRIQDERFAPLDRVRLPMTNALEGTPFEEELEMERARSTMDTYNEMYVALTRAKQRLYVHGKIPGKDSKGSRSNTAIKLIRGYLLDAGLIQDNELVYMEGRHQKVQLAPHHQPAQLSLQSVGNPNWQQRLKIARPVADNDIALSELDARQLGIAMHEAMESIITRDDLPKAVQRLLERGTISQTESELIAERIGNLLEKSELRDLYTPNVSVRNEADIQLASGEWIRPDRVVTAGKKAWVIDYKNGEERSEHVRQVQQYKSAVMELGFTDVDGLLVYLESEKVVRI